MANAAKRALEDAGVQYDAVQQAYAGYVFGDSTCGQRAIYEVGLASIPVFNVNNNCSTGSTALMLGAQAIQSGVDCVLVVGFEQMERGALGSKYDDRTNPLEQHAQLMIDVQGFAISPPAAQMFGGAGREYQWKHGTRRDLRQDRRESSKAASNNPYALFKDTLSVEEILASPEVFDPLTRYQCCPLLAETQRRFCVRSVLLRSTRSLAACISPLRQWLRICPVVLKRAA